MAIDIQARGMAGSNALKIKGLTSGVKSATVSGTTITFTMNDDSQQVMTFPTPADGKDGANGISIVDLEITPTNHLIGTFSDGSVVDAGLITTVKGERGYTGAAGKDGKDGIDGTNGVDGISPTVTITESTGRHTVSITDKDGVKSFVVKDGSALDVDNYYTKDEVIAELATKANTADIPVVPVNVSEFTNDAGYIKNTVDNLVHYYNKADTYTQAEVNTLISNINKLTSQIVDQLPTEDIDTSVIYLIKQEDTNAYMQYMYISSAWAELGTTQVDLSDYYKKSEVDTKLADKADKTELPTVPSVVSAFTNDVGYLTEYTETDPTVPAWAKAENKPTYTAAEVGALPEDTEIPIFTNKAILDKISEEKIESWDEAVTSAHIHDNKIILDKFSENDEGKVVYDNKPLASDNLWHGTQAEYDALGEYDENKTYVITDGSEDVDLSEVVIDDASTTATNKTYSVAKIINLLTNWQTVTLNETVSDVAVKKLKIGNVIFMHTHINGLSYTGYGGMGDTLFSTSDSEIIKPTASITDVVRSIIDVDDKNSNPMKRMPADIDFHLKTGEFKLYCMGESTQELTNVNLYGDIFSIIYP